MKVKVAEMFYSIQGEGPYAGTPAIFLRLAGCNLQCGHAGDIQDYEEGDDPTKDGADWICDTIDVWREPEGAYEAEELFQVWEDSGWWDRIDEGAHIVLTGGEPTLPGHQQAMREFYNVMVSEGYSPFIEVETNGTMKPEPGFIGLIDQYNVSLKLSNSGHSEAERLNEEAIDKYVDMGPERALFKFVVADVESVAEIDSITSRYKIPDEQISLMPAGATQAQLRETYPIVAELCKERGWDFSPRLHVDVWNEKTGV